METKEILTVQEVAELLDLTAKTVERKIRDGTIPGYRLPGGRRLYIKRSDLLAALEPVAPVAVMDINDEVE